jgi:hypothetical protein
MSTQPAESVPDARISVTVATDPKHDLESALNQLNPILRQIVQARDAVQPAEGAAPQATPVGFGRIHFSRSWS